MNIGTVSPSGRHQYCGEYVEVCLVVCGVLRIQQEKLLLINPLCIKDDNS